VEITEAKTKEWLKLEVSHDFDLLKLAWIQLWDVDNFTGFPKSSKSSKSEFGAKSYAHNTNLDCGKKLQQHKTVVHKRSGVQNLLKLAWFQLWVVENFISFSKSTRSSKSKFGAKSYGQNTTSILFYVRGPVAIRFEGPVHQFRSSNGYLWRLVHMEVRCAGLVHHRKLHNCFLTANFGWGSIYTTLPNHL
jgi:hypothetical protein